MQICEHDLHDEICEHDLHDEICEHDLHDEICEHDLHDEIENIVFEYQHKGTIFVSGDLY